MAVIFHGNLFSCAGTRAAGRPAVYSGEFALFPERASADWTGVFQSSVINNFSDSVLFL
jgi:hypothetical protein